MQYNVNIISAKLIPEYTDSHLGIGWPHILLWLEIVNMTQVSITTEE